MSQTSGVRCLDDELFEYAAGRLPAPRLVIWERHLAVCDLCASGLQRERRLRVALAGAPSMPGDLRSALLALGRAIDPPVAAPSGSEPLALLSPGAPPCHRSPLRATVVAAAAVGVSAAAAWSLSVMGAPATGSSPRYAARDAAASPSPSPTALSGAATSTVGWMPVGTALLVRGQQAQSTP